MKELFDFNYTLECYITAAKRKVGYFSLPLLYGTDFVGQIDLKADRKNRVPIVKNLVWEEAQVKNMGKLFPVLEKDLVDFRGFSGF